MPPAFVGELPLHPLWMVWLRQERLLAVGTALALLANGEQVVTAEVQATAILAAVGFTGRASNRVRTGSSLKKQP